MGLFDSIGDFFSPAKSTSTNVQLDKWDAYQRALEQSLASQAQAGLTNGESTYPGQMYTPTTPTEQAYLNYQRTPPTNIPGYDYTAGMSDDEVRDNRKVREAALREAMSGKPAFTVNDASTQQYWNTVLAPQYEKQKRALEESYAPGYFGGGRDVAGAEFAGQTAAGYGNLLYADEQARRAALEAGLNRQAQVAPGAWLNNETVAAQNSLNDYYANLTAQQLNNTNNQAYQTALESSLGLKGSLERQIAQEKAATDYQRWVSGEQMGGVSSQAGNPNRQLALALLGLSPYAYQQNVTNTGAGLGYGMLQGAAQGAGQAAGAYLTGGLGSIGGLGKGVSENPLTSNVLSQYKNPYSVNQAFNLFGQ